MNLRFSGPAKDKDGESQHVPGGSSLSRKEIDDYTSFVARYGAKGLAYIKIEDISKKKDGMQSPILKFLPDEVIDELVNRVDINDGDIIFFGADKESIVNDALGALRVRIGKRFKSIRGRMAATLGD